MRNGWKMVTGALNQWAGQYGGWGQIWRDVDAATENIVRSRQIRGGGAPAGASPSRAVPGRRAPAQSKAQPEHGTFYVDSKGNVIPTPPGGGVVGSPNGRYIQARDAAGNPTGVRIDGGHKPAGHPDPRAQQPHGHVPGVTNPDGTPWLPIKP